MALARKYISMQTGVRSSFFDTQPRKDTHETNFLRLHQQAIEQAENIKKERKELLILDQHIAAITADTEHKIMIINAELSEKIRNLNEERDLEVNLVRERADELTTHIKNASRGADEAIAAPVAAPVSEKYEVKLK